MDGAIRLMHIADAQRDVRRTYVGGFFGQLISGVVWLAASAAGTWLSVTAGVLVLLLGGVLIFPLTTLSLLLSGRRASLPAGHPMTPLAMQIAFTVPCGLLVATAVVGYRPDWFFPAAMVIVGAHYLPFTFLYGMRAFAVLAAIMVGAGVVLALWIPVPFAAGGWLTGSLLVGFAFVSLRMIAVEHLAAEE